MKITYAVFTRFKDDDSARTSHDDYEVAYDRWIVNQQHHHTRFSILFEIMDGNSSVIASSIPPDTTLRDNERWDKSMAKREKMLEDWGKYVKRVEQKG